MKKRRNVGKRLSIFTIVLAFVVVFMGLWVFNIWLGNKFDKKSNSEAIAIKDGIQTENLSDICYDNYWVKSIITNIVDENVPIPEGLEYVSRN